MHLFFYGHKPKTQGIVDSSCLSQWYPSEFEEEGVKFYSAEQYMMFKKAETFGDEEIARKILQTRSPKEAKALGRKVKNFDPKRWVEVRESIVFQGNLCKFRQNPDLKKYLLGTKGQTLVEAAKYDLIWGIGLSPSEAKEIEPCKWKGLNLLGKALMMVRKCI